MNPNSVYYFAQPIKVPANTIYFINAKGEMEYVTCGVEIERRWRITGPRK